MEAKNFNDEIKEAVGVSMDAVFGNEQMKRMVRMTMVGQLAAGVLSSDGSVSGLEDPEVRRGFVNALYNVVDEIIAQA